MKIEINILNIKELKKYKYDVYSSGIYILWNEEKVVYVGQSNNLYQRLASHKTQYKNKWDSYSIIRESNYVKRVAIEAYLINDLRPYLNRNINGEYIGTGSKLPSKHTGKKSKSFTKKRRKIAKNLYENKGLGFNEIINILKSKYNIHTTRQTLDRDRSMNWEYI